MDTRTLCLGVVYRGPASGYEIKKSFEEGPLAHIHEASFGAIYPALTRLAAEGLVDCRELPQDKRPDKKVYAITPSGCRAFEAALRQLPAPDKVRSDFLFMLFFAHVLPSEHLERIVDQRIAWYEETIARMRDCADAPDDPPGQSYVRGFGLAVYQAARDYLVANRAGLLAAASASPAAAE